MPEIAVAGKRVFFTTGGKAWEEGLPRLVFVHGAGSSQTVWVSQSRALAHHGWNSVALDLPGHGRSEDGAGIASVEDYAAWLAELLAALESEPGGSGPAVLVGHSLGAAIALTCAAEVPERVSALVLLGTRAHMEVNPKLLADTRDAPRRASGFITAFGHAAKTHFGGAPTPGAWLLGSARALIDRSPAVVLHRDFQASHDWRGEPYAARVSCPALVLAGADDRMTPAAAGRELAAAIPGARFERVAGAGHFMMHEQPRAVLAAMREFLQSLPEP